jgi:hypothetical protein
VSHEDAYALVKTLQWLGGLLTLFAFLTLSAVMTIAVQLGCLILRLRGINLPMMVIDFRNLYRKRKDRPMAGA